MELILALIVAGGCAAAGLAALRKRRRGSEQVRRAQLQLEAASEPRGLEALRPEDVLLYDKLELLVLGVARFSQATSKWQECRAEDGSDERWLVLRESDPEHLLIGSRAEGISLPEACEPSEQIEDQGTIFRLERCGQASVSLVGELGEGVAPGEWRFWDYARAGADRLWIRRGSESFHCYRGQRVGRHLVTFLPGS